MSLSANRGEIEGKGIRERGQKEERRTGNLNSVFY